MEGTKYCKGFQPPVMENVYELFPFQLLPSIEIAVFENNYFHHKDCMNKNYILQKGANNVNDICSHLSMNLSVKSVVQLYQ